MFKKKTMMLGAGLLLVSGLFSACAAEATGVETQLGTVVADSELTASFPPESAEYSEITATDTDYMDYIRPLGYLLNGQSWAEPADISPDDMLMWYALYERDQNGVDLESYRMEDGTYRFSRKALEETVTKYFGPLARSLRSRDSDDRFDPEADEYILRSELPEFTQSIHVTRVEDQGNLQMLYFTVTINQLKQEYILTLTAQNGAVLYQSLAGPEGETDTPALTALSVYAAHEENP